MRLYQSFGHIGVVFVRPVIRRKKGIFNYNIYSPNICFFLSQYIGITRYIYGNIMLLLVTTRQGSSLKLCGLPPRLRFLCGLDQMTNYRVFDWYLILFMEYFSSRESEYMRSHLRFVWFFFQILFQLYVWYTENLPYRYLYYIFYAWCYFGEPTSVPCLSRGPWIVSNTPYVWCFLCVLS